MKYKVGDIVKFSENFIKLSKTQGGTSWIRDVIHLIDKPLTIAHVDSVRYVVKEDKMGFGFSEDWFELYEEPFELGEELFKV